MRNRSLTTSLVAAALAVSGGCAGPSSSTPAIRLVTSSGQPPAVEVDGLSRSDRAAIAQLALTEEEWARVLRVIVALQAVDAFDRPPVAGRYEINETLRFTPLYPLEAGRQYDVTFDVSKAARPGLPSISPAHAIVGLPGAAHAPETIVSAVYPSGDAIPENQLRMYVHFSAPMGQQSPLGKIMLADRDGQEIADALLPLDTELWNADRTRLTVLFDPGRVKREILPNRKMGRPLHVGETVTLIVRPDWQDAHGAPLASEFRHEYVVRPAIEAPLSTSAWKISAPAAGTRDPLRIAFPGPLDHALLLRALGVSRDGSTVPGTVRIEEMERVWMFEPRDPWQQGLHALVVQAILEDLAGNRIGRAFEVRSPGEFVPPEDTMPIEVPFQTASKPR